jgi:hypothetical protein
MQVLATQPVMLQQSLCFTTNYATFATRLQHDALHGTVPQLFQQICNFLGEKIKIAAEE